MGLLENEKGVQGVASRGLAVGSGGNGVRWPLEMGRSEGPGGQEREDGAWGMKI